MAAVEIVNAGKVTGGLLKQTGNIYGKTVFFNNQCFGYYRLRLSEGAKVADPVLLVWWQRQLAVIAGKRT